MAYDFSEAAFRRKVEERKQNVVKTAVQAEETEIRSDSQSESSETQDFSPNDTVLVSDSSNEVSKSDDKSDVEINADGVMLPDEQPVPDMGISSDEDGIGCEPAIQQDVRRDESRPKSPVHKKLPPINSDNTKGPVLKSVRVNRDGVLSARSIMRELRSDSDAVDACLFCLFGDIDVPDHVKAAAEKLDHSLSRTDPAAMFADTQRLIKRMVAMERRNERLLRELQLAIVFLLGDRLNYDVGMSSVPSQVDFLWPQYDLLYRRLLSQTEQFKKEQDEISGRELYENKANGKEIVP